MAEPQQVETRGGIGYANHDGVAMIQRLVGTSRHVQAAHNDG